MCVLGVVSRGGWGALRPVTLCEVMICVAHSFLDHVQVNLSYLWLPLSREVIIVYSAATGRTFYMKMCKHSQQQMATQRNKMSFQEEVADVAAWRCLHRLAVPTFPLTLFRD